MSPTISIPSWTRLLALAGLACLMAVGARLSLGAEEKLEIKKIDPPEGGYYAKVLDYHGIPIKAGAAVSDAAIIEAYHRIDSQLKNSPMIVSNLVAAGEQLHIFGKDEFPSDLPENRSQKGQPYPGEPNMTIDTRTRGTGGRLTSCAEENLLNLPIDHYISRDICRHEFGHAIQGYGLSQNVRDEIQKAYDDAMAKNLWKPAYASTNSSEYFSEMTMWYFGSHGEMTIANLGVTCVPGPEWLKKYDPEGYAIVDKIYSGKADVRAVTPGQRRGGGRRRAGGDAATTGTQSRRGPGGANRAAPGGRG